MLRDKRSDTSDLQSMSCFHRGFQTVGSPGEVFLSVVTRIWSAESLVRHNRIQAQLAGCQTVQLRELPSGPATGADVNEWCPRGPWRETLPGMFPGQPRQRHLA
jgi:hypothetical protein